MKIKTLLILLIFTLLLISCENNKDPLIPYNDNNSNNNNNNNNDFSNDDKDNSTPSEVEKNTSINLKNPDTLIGTYDIIFYAINVGEDLTFTNKCDDLYSDTKFSPCGDNILDNVELKGEATIQKNSNNDYIITTKVQMNGGLTENEFEINDYKYEYTKYNPIPKSEINENGININNNIKGTSTRNINSRYEIQNDTFKFTLQQDGTLSSETIKTINLLKREIYFIMKKKSDEYIELKENEPYNEPKLDWFEQNVN